MHAPVYPMDQEKKHSRRELSAAHVLASLDSTKMQKKFDHQALTYKVENDFNNCLREAQAGNKEAMLRLVEFYNGGRGIRKNSRKADEWLLRATTVSHYACNEKL